MFKQGDRVTVQGITEQGTVDTTQTAPSGKLIIIVDLDSGMTVPCFAEELAMSTATPDTLDPIKVSGDALKVAHELGGHVVRVSTGGSKTKMTMHLAFRNIGDKMMFNYAMQVAHPSVFVVNHRGTINVDIVVPRFS